MSDTNPPGGPPEGPWTPDPETPWRREPWVPSEPPGAPVPPGYPVAPGPDTSPTQILPGGVPSWGWDPATGGAPAGLPILSPGTAPRRGPRVSRRAALIGAGAGALGLGVAGAGLDYWLTHRAGGVAGTPDLSNAGQIFHLLRRAGFGARPGEVGEYISLGVSGAIERLLNPASVSDNLDATLAKLNLDLTKPQDMQRWFLLRMIYTQRPLEEKLTLFWHGLLTSSFRKIGGKQGYSLLIQQNQLLRSHAFGRFDDLIRAISTDPAMMWWLDLRLSTAAAPNENYARELMELFTLGIGNYAQADVEAGSRALTGWTLRRNGGSIQSVFVSSRHDGGVKTYLGQTGNLGLDDVVRIVCAHPATAHHLAWRLWTFFAYENPSDADLQPLIDAYNHQNHNIGAMMHALLTSPQFFGEKAYRQRIKSPAEFVVGAVRALEVPTAGQNLAPELALMGQSLFDPPNVAGWDGDKISASWVSTQSWMTRVNFVNALVAAASGGAHTGQAAGTGANATSGTSPLQALIDAHQIATPQALIDFFVDTLLDNQLASDRRATIADYLAQASPAATTSATTGAMLTLHGGTSLSAVAARGALYLLMSLPEYQLN